MLGDALERGHVAKPDIVVLGDPFAVPEDHLRGLRADGVPMVVAAGSVASALWPDAPTWATEADVVNAIVEPVPPPAAELREPKLRATRPAPGRAQRVSVGIPVFRNHVYLDACVASILAQEQQPAEIVIVDDGSRSAEAEAAIARWCDAHPGLIRSLRQPNRGVCAARNLALEAMTGDAFVLVDADDELDPDFISACATALRADGSLSAVATWTEFHGTYEGIEAKPPFDARVGRRENPIISTCVLVDMAVRDEGIRFTPDLAFLYCEDWDVWAQIVAAGGRFGLVPEPLARHRVHRSSGGFQRTALAASLGKARATARLRE